ncbi:MAG TPA: hypothetical protein VKB84_09545 [Candidatus Binataceae bacterium]|nr:hypothetical protein [Candidatus Binataceae bacterium]
MLTIPPPAIKTQESNTSATQDTAMGVGDLFANTTGNYNAGCGRRFDEYISTFRRVN